MSAESIIGISALQSVPSGEAVVAASNPFAGAAGSPKAATASFADLVTRSIGEVNARLVDSQVDLHRLASGDVENLHQVLIGLEESRLSFQLMLQVRNRLLESYQELMRMQV